MTVEDIIAGYYDETKESAECDAYANTLYQEALRISMELNNQYHTPDEIREIMSRLTGQQIDKSFRLFPPFYTDFGKNTHIGKNVFINLLKGVVVIPGSSNPEHIRENLDLFGFELTDEEMEQINALDRNEKHDWY